MVSTIHELPFLPVLLEHPLASGDPSLEGVRRVLRPPVLGGANDRHAGSQTAEQWYESSGTRHALPKTARVPSSRWLDASSTKGDTWKGTVQIMQKRIDAAHRLQSLGRSRNRQHEMEGQ